MDRKIHGHTSILDYDFDWTAYLAANDANDADAIAEASWSITPQMQISNDGQSGLPGASVFQRTVSGVARTFCKVWLGEAEAGCEYRLTNRVVTQAGREDEMSVLVLAVDR